MFKTPPKPMRLSLRALAALLRYPEAELRAAMPELLDALRSEGALKPARLAEIDALCRHLQHGDGCEIEVQYVETFDRSRSASLHLFEHLHGDSRQRGPALAELQQTYERAGLMLLPGELPDYLPVLLEFASTLPADTARSLLGEMEELLIKVFSALQKRESPYASVLAAVIELAGGSAHAVALAPEPALDESWAEPAAFDGCSTQGQAKPGSPQPIHIVRKNSAGVAA